MSAPTLEDYAYSKLLSYVRYQWPKYIIGKHHALIAAHLEAVERGDITRLIITTPPRHGKCVSKDTLVTMADMSQKKISGIKVGDNVLSYDDAKLSVGTVLETYKCTTVCMQIVVKSGRSIILSENHRMLTESGYIEAANLMVGECFISLKTNKKGGLAFSCDPIVSIEYAGAMDTVDIQISGTHNFLANDMVSHNSLLVSEFFPAWYMGRNPADQIIFATYSHDKAGDTGKKVRNQMADPLFAGIFPEAEIARDSQSVSNVGTRAGGNFYAVGAGGAITGRGANCLTGDTLVSTDIGHIRIDVLHAMKNPPFVFAYNSERNKVEKCRILKTRKTYADRIVTVVSRNGNLLRCTEDHRIFIGAGRYRKAGECNPGESLTIADDSMVATIPCQAPRIFPDILLSVDSEQSGTEPVYDIQVEDLENFFANGILVHNCFIMDDVIKGAEEADSVLTKMKMQEWYRSTMYTRLMPKNAIILIMCVAKGERVLMGDGTWRPIETINVNDDVISYENGLPVKKKVLQARCSGNDEIIEVISRSCSLKVNRRHPFLVVRGGLKKSARNGADVAQAKKWDLEWVKAGELKPGDTVVTIKKMQNIGGVRPACFQSKKQMNQKDYWLLGFLFGDGWLLNSKNRGILGFCVANSDKPELDAYVRSTIEERFGVRLKTTRFGYDRCDCVSIGKWLHKIGLRSGAHHKRVPGWIFKLRQCDKRSFLKGFFAADGHERIPGTFEVTICNYNLLDDLRLLARTCGFKTTKIYKYHGEGQPPSSPKVIAFSQFTARFYNKYNKVELGQRYKGQGKSGRYFRFENIESVNLVGRSEVYDLTVEGTENFIAEGFVVHNTRWRDDDLAGWLLSEHADEGWTHLKLPAICEEGPDEIGRMPGDALWPEFYPAERLMKIKKAVGTRVWNALFQQDPVGAAGGIIKIDWLRYYDNPPEKFTRIVQSWDTAFKASQLNDPSACITFGETKSEVYVLDVFKKRMEYPELRKQAINQYAKWKPNMVIIEDKASGQSLIQDLKNGTKIPVVPIKPESDKVTRMSSESGFVEAGKLLLPSRAAWLVDYETELTRFPYAKHDDCVDATSQFLKYMKRPRYRISKGAKFWK